MLSQYFFLLLSKMVLNTVLFITLGRNTCPVLKSTPCRISNGIFDVNFLLKERKLCKKCNNRAEILLMMKILIFKIEEVTAC